MGEDERYMREALQEARYALADGEIPIGAVVVGRGRVIGRGHNMTEKLHDTTAHAEMLAVTAANWAQIGRIVYGAIDPRRGYSLFTPSLLHPKTQVAAGVLAEECSALMKDFFKERR